METREGTSLQSLQLQLEEHFNSGQPVELVLGIVRPLSDSELAQVEEELRRGGLELLAPVEVGIAPWPNTLRLAFRRPVQTRGYGILPLAVLLIAAIGAVGVGGVLGWRLGELIAGLTENLPLVLILGAAGFIVWSIFQKQPARS